TLVDHWEKIEGEAQQDGPAGEPPGAKRALRLKAGDVLIFEEVIGPKTGNPADADPRHRQAVRLTRVTPAIDPLYHPFSSDYGQPIVEIEWCSEDALTFPLCLSAKMPPPDCDCREGISVARGNVILVHNSVPYEEPVGTVDSLPPEPVCATDCEHAETLVTARDFGPHLSQRPLTFSQPLPACGCASEAIVQDPRRALPRNSLSGESTPPRGGAASSSGAASAKWRAKSDLLGSSPDDNDFVVEM